MHGTPGLPTSPRWLLLTALLFGSVATASDIPTRRPQPESNPTSPPATASWSDLESLTARIAGSDSRRQLLDRFAGRPEAGDSMLNLVASPPESSPSLTQSLDILPTDDRLASDVPSSETGSSKGTKREEPHRFPIPEPTSSLLVLAGLVGLYVRRQLRRNLGPGAKSSAMATTDEL